MNRTKVPTIILLFAAGAVGAAFLESALAASGRPILIPPFTLPAALVAIGIIIVLLALPIRRKVKGTRTTPVDPFHATRMAMLAKASSISGALPVRRRWRGDPLPHHALGTAGRRIDRHGDRHRHRGRRPAGGRTRRRALVHHSAGEGRRRNGHGPRTRAPEAVSGAGSMSTRLELRDTAWRRVSPKLMWAELVGSFLGGCSSSRSRFRCICCKFRSRWRSASPSRRSRYSRSCWSRGGCARSATACATTTCCSVAASCSSAWSPCPTGGCSWSTSPGARSAARSASPTSSSSPPRHRPR